MDAREARDTARADQADRAADRADDRAEAADRAAEPSANVDRDDTHEATADQPVREEPEPEPHAHNVQPPAPLLVQLIAANQTQAEPPAQPPAQTTPAAAATANTTAPPEAPVIVAETTPAAPNAGAAKKAPARDTNAKTAKVEAMPDASATPAPQTTPPVVAPVQVSAPQTTPPETSSDGDKAAIAAVDATPMRDASARAPKADTGAKIEAPAQPARARADDAGASTPAPANTAKAASVAHAAVAASRAADTPAPTPLSAAPATPAAASIQTPVQTQHVTAPDESGLRTAPIASQVGHEIVRRFGGGSTQFDIRLDPPELGRVDVRLEVSRDQRVTATISADTPQALHELARHARDLEQTLQSAGLELSDSGLSFDLRQGGDDRGRANSDSGAASAANARADTSSAEQTPVARPRLEGWRGVRIDMMV
jgi:flagellar hook-length control protein FliK